MGSALALERLVVGPWQVNCYLLHDGSSGMVIDPGGEADRIAQRVEELGVKPIVILATHGHFDHVGAVAPLKERFAVPFLVHGEDRRLVGQANLYRRLAGAQDTVATPTIDGLVNDGEEIQLGCATIAVLHTPGHTAGSICLEVDNWILTGDTLFSDGVGRTDLPGGCDADLRASLAVLSRRDPESQVFPGHGPSDLLGRALSRRQGGLRDG